MSARREEHVLDGPGDGEPLSIALMGTRGVPARYGGFETAIEEVGRRLVERGVQVRDEGRTVGELDFIVFNTRQGVYELWEVAVRRLGIEPQSLVPASGVH